MEPLIKVYNVKLKFKEKRKGALRVGPGLHVMGGLGLR